jgi:hypothetical protein
MNLRARPGPIAALLVWTATAVSCSGNLDRDAKGGADADGGPSKPGVTANCVSARAVFAQEVVTPVFNRICMQCHSPDGVAVAQNAKFQLLPTAYPGFLNANFDNARYVARFSFDGKSVLLRKPLGEMDHGGGARLKADSKEYKALEKFVTLLEGEDKCGAVGEAPQFVDVTLMPPLATFRKATLQLAGRLPTDAERDRLRKDGEKVLAPLIDDVLEEPAFLDRLKDIYNDLLLTDLYLAYNGAAINLLNNDQYPASVDAAYDGLDEALRAKTNRAVARESLELIAYVVKNDRPFSEILTADYTVVNPFSATMYGVSPAFKDATDVREFVEAKVTLPDPDGAAALPHAGILTMPTFLNRFPTTPTNRNRHRARKIYEMFLATDILRIAERPIDPTASGRYNNPTRDDPQCVGCHRQMDPVAGAFLKWNEYDAERFEPNAEWHPEMFPPGFGKEVMDTRDYPRSQQWLAERIVRDPRFVLATVQTLYRGLTGHQPLAYPPDPDSPMFEANRRAWEAQDSAFGAVGAAFVDDDMNLKTLVRGLILSPYFRASNADKELSAARALELTDVGTGRLTIPTVMARKIEAVTGYPWTRGWDKSDQIISEYNVLYGGIDSDTVVDRLTKLNGVMANVAARMANEVACESTARDLNKPKAERLLFPDVDVSDVPETDAGLAVPEAAARIRKNIQHLHERVLGEVLELNDPEIDRTYTLFYDTWKEGLAKVKTDALNKQIMWRCQARVDPVTGADLPDGSKLDRDENYAVRAWMAVLTYLFSDHGFLYE